MMIHWATNKKLYVLRITDSPLHFHQHWIASLFPIFSAVFTVFRIWSHLTGYNAYLCPGAFTPALVCKMRTPASLWSGLTKWGHHVQWRRLCTLLNHLLCLPDFHRCLVAVNWCRHSVNHWSLFQRPKWFSALGYSCLLLSEVSVTNGSFTRLCS